MSFLNRFRKQRTTPTEPEPVQVPTPESRAKGFVPPPPRQAPERSPDPGVERLRQRIAALEHEIEMVERSGDPDSPYQQRLGILATALESIEQEIAEATPLQSRDVPALEPSPITNIAVELEPVPRVSFQIGDQVFRYSEEIDWAERGTQIVHGDLMGDGVDVRPLVPIEFPSDLRDELADHLEQSLFAFATDLRDRSIDGRALPMNVTLADLAVPSPDCGDWQLWGGISLRCLEHDARLRELNAERARLLTERSSDIEERQRQVEELPIQRRRLNQAIADLQQREAGR